MAATNLIPKLAAAPSVGTNTLRDIKPPVEIPNAWAWVLWTLGVIALAALSLWAWRYWQRRRAEIPPVPVIPPHVRARQKLEEALALLSQPREFCILVSDTIRYYLEERFNFHAPDQKSSLGEFLGRCDLVKFARYEPREPELRDLHASALRLVEETEPVAPVDSDTQQATRSPESALRTSHSALR